MADVAPHQTEILAGLTTLLVGGFWAWIKRLLKSLEGVPALTERVNRIEGDMLAIIKESALVRENYIRDIAELKSGQASHREGQERLTMAIDNLSSTVSTLHRDLTKRIDDVVARG